jgi:hypothetical protein
MNKLGFIDVEPNALYQGLESLMHEKAKLLLSLVSIEYKVPVSTTQESKDEDEQSQKKTN